MNVLGNDTKICYLFVCFFLQRVPLSQMKIKGTSENRKILKIIENLEIMLSTFSQKKKTQHF